MEEYQLGPLVSWRRESENPHHKEREEPWEEWWWGVLREYTE